jgi:HJR/Mrr/RecB family endonuclease
VNYVKTTGDIANLLIVGCPTKYIPIIANTVANELGVNIREFDGIGTKSGDFSAVLTNLGVGEIFSFTNISHSLPEIVNLLEEAMLDFAITITIGKGASARTIHMPLCKFSSILAVDSLKEIPSSIIETFYYIIDFSKYKKELRLFEISRYATKYNLIIPQFIKEKIATQYADNDQLKIKLIELRNRAFDANVQEITEDLLQENCATIPEFDKIDAMDGREFELFTGELFRALGYTNVTVTQSSCDFGADVIAEKDDVRFAIQCKRYSAPVGVSAVQEVIASKSLHDCHVACILTNNTFTPAAEELARKNLVILWDGNKLKEFIERTT